MDNSDNSGISGFLSATDIVTIYHKYRILTGKTIFCDLGSGLGHVTLTAALFGIEASVGFDVHRASVLNSIRAYLKLINREDEVSRRLKDTPVILHEASAANMLGIGPVTSVFCFMGCDYLAQLAANIVASTSSIKTGVIVYTHDDYLTNYGFVVEGVDVEGVDYRRVGNARMPGGKSYPAVLLLMSECKRLRMKRQLEEGGWDHAAEPNDWTEVGESIRDVACRDKYRSEYEDKFLDQPKGRRAARDRNVTHFSPPEAKPRPKQPKKKGQPSGTSHAAQLAASKQENAQQLDRIRELEAGVAENALQADRIRKLEADVEVLRSRLAAAGLEVEL